MGKVTQSTHKTGKDILRRMDPNSIHTCAHIISEDDAKAKVLIETKVSV